MNLRKKCAAVLTAGALALSMAACSSDTSWIMRKDPLEMPVGVYINNLIQSYYEATTLVEDAEQDVLSQQIEGQDAEDWIQQNAIDETKKAMAICSEFNARNIAFSQEQLLSCQEQAASYYEQAGDNLEKNGISQDSIELIYQIAYMKTQLFQALYGPSGGPGIRRGTEQLLRRQLHQDGGTDLQLLRHGDPGRCHRGREGSVRGIQR